MTALSDAAASSAVVSGINSTGEGHTRAVKELRESGPTGGTLARLHVHARNCLPTYDVIICAICLPTWSTRIRT